MQFQGVQLQPLRSHKDFHSLIFLILPRRCCKHLESRPHKLVCKLVHLHMKGKLHLRLHHSLRKLHLPQLNQLTLVLACGKYLCQRKGYHIHREEYICTSRVQLHICSLVLRRGNNHHSGIDPSRTRHKTSHNHGRRHLLN